MEWGGFLHLLLWNPVGLPYVLVAFATIWSLFDTPLCLRKEMCFSTDKNPGEI